MLRMPEPVPLQLVPRIPILAPILNANICPIWSDRWELRTRTLGCHVSTITFLTCVISVLTTLVVIGLVVLEIKLGRKAHASLKARSEGWWKVWRYYQPGWWRGWRLRLVDIRDVESERPLLGNGR
ncbi:hypothetical protein LSUE1_G005427 [Lachnellula suecica]|uniref:Uncharacterized protein n=1 Tax=Lachnellula suecica TaxID=602035 RepID=A0A8T9C5E4_9HELO|nr:hypothetical protein LSUE1_G005427 [Lachnellula suecica]